MRELADQLVYLKTKASGSVRKLVSKKKKLGAIEEDIHKPRRDILTKQSEKDNAITLG